MARIYTQGIAQGTKYRMTEELGFTGDRVLKAMDYFVSGAWMNSYDYHFLNNPDDDLPF